MGLVGQAGEEAADASDGDGEDEGVDPSVAGAFFGVGEEFGDFDADPTADEAADDGFSADPGFESMGFGLGEVLVEGFDPVEDFCAGECAGDGAGEVPEVSFEVLVFELGLEGKVEGEAGEVGGEFHDGVGGGG